MADETGLRVALTGATGFLGRAVAAALVRKGCRVRALARRSYASELPEGVEIERGDLADEAALRRLVAGADRVVHVAGLIKALDRPAFFAANQTGVEALCRALLSAAPGADLVLVSSLAAREPQLSDYAASKRAGEEVAARLMAPERLTVVRPPAIYGPGDRETLFLFKTAKLLVTPVFGNGRERIAFVHVDDAAAAIAALALAPRPGTYCIADDRPAGYTAREIMSEAARAVGASPRIVNLPVGLIWLAAGLSGAVARLRRVPTLLSPGKVREILHEDWSVDPGSTPAFIQQSSINLRQGFETTVAWYRREGWL